MVVTVSGWVGSMARELAMKKATIITLGIVLSLCLFISFSLAVAQGYQENSIAGSNDHDRLVKTYHELAEEGLINAQVTLARNFAVGIWGQKNLNKAAYWFEKAAEQGDKEAQVIIGWMYAEGKGVVADPAEAVHWYRMAAVQGETKAQVNLAFSYTAGSGVVQDNRQAVFWLKQAAKLGDVRAQFMLGVHLLKGKGIEQNLVNAQQWFQRAAEQGNKKAIKALELLTDSGLVLHDQGTITIPKTNSNKTMLLPVFSDGICSLSTDCNDGFLCDEIIRKCITNLEWIRKYPDI